MQKPDWRRAYHFAIDNWRDALRDERKNKYTISYLVPGHRRAKLVGDLTDDEINSLARLLAEKDIQEKINQTNAEESQRRYRKGEAQ